MAELRTGRGWIVGAALAGIDSDACNMSYARKACMAKGRSGAGKSRLSMPGEGAGLQAWY